MTGPRNLITDVPGILIGNAHDEALGSGVTVALFERSTVTSCSVLGGAPGTRETDLLEPDKLAIGADAIVLAGGSAYGLDAASAVQAYLREQGLGMPFGSLRVPLVPQAIIFDLLNGGDKEWGRYPPYRELGYEACRRASRDFALGSVGGGYGATTINLKGGLGSASAVTSSGYTVGALAVVNSISSAVIGDGPHFWAAPYEEGDEFGGLGLPPRVTREMRRIAWKGGRQPATTIALIATDAALTKSDAKRLATAAHGGLAKALRFAHGFYDGDVVFAAGLGHRPLPDDPSDFTELTVVAGDCLARAVARGVYEATALPYCDLPAWKDLFGGR